MNGGYGQYANKQYGQTNQYSSYGKGQYGKQMNNCSRNTGNKGNYSNNKYQNNGMCMCRNMGNKGYGNQMNCNMRGGNNYQIW